MKEWCTFIGKNVFSDPHMRMWGFFLSKSYSQSERANSNVAANCGLRIAKLPRAQATYMQRKRSNGKAKNSVDTSGETCYHNPERNSRK